MAFDVHAAPSSLSCAEAGRRAGRRCDLDEPAAEGDVLEKFRFFFQVCLSHTPTWFGRWSTTYAATHYILVPCGMTLVVVDMVEWGRV